MSVTVEEIRKKYPKPVIALPENLKYADSYCVGGALCKFIYGRDGEAFPISQLNRALCSANPELRRHERGVFSKAEEFGAAIIEANDSGSFDAAWQILEAALNWRRA